MRSTFCPNKKGRYYVYRPFSCILPFIYDAGVTVIVAVGVTVGKTAAVGGGGGSVPVGWAGGGGKVIGGVTITGVAVIIIAPTGVAVITTGGCTTMTGKPGVAVAAGSGGATTTGSWAHGPVAVTTRADTHPCVVSF